MSRPHAAVEDPALRAVVVARTPLRYEEGADTSLDRPAHVRAGSSLARVPGGLALVQDDANFIAVVDPDTNRVRAVPLPEGPDGGRQFDDRRGNKHHKLDLEACVSMPTPDGVLLLAFGSGSTPAREQVAVVRGWEAGRPHVDVVHVPRLYELLRRDADFAGSELNVEGAVVLGDRVRLFGRGNGAPRDGVQPVNATCDLNGGALLAHLLAADRHPPPTPTDVVRFELGEIGGVPLGFTDATVWRETVLYTATAEESPDVTRDGPVTGSVIGSITGLGARWTPVVDACGAPLTAKVEGVVAESASSNRLFIVVDADDPDAASELCTVELHSSS